MPNPRSLPLCVFHRRHEFYDVVRRNRGRFRRHVKPYLRGLLCHCNVPWEPDRRVYHSHNQRTFWMRVQACELLDALGPLGATLVGDLALVWGTPAEDVLHDADSAHFVDVIEVTIDRPDWSFATAALRSRGCGVTHLRGSLELDADGDFAVNVRLVRGTDAGLDCATLRAKMAAHYPSGALARYLPRPPC